MKKQSVFTFFSTMSLVSLSLIACGVESATEFSSPTTNQPPINIGIESSSSVTESSSSATESSSSATESSSSATESSSSATESSSSATESSSSATESSSSATESSSSSSAKSSSSAVSPATKTCKLFFCGDETADQSEVDLGNGVKAYWAARHDEFSYFIWPEGVKGDNFYSPENVATYKAIKGTAHYYRDKDTGAGFIDVRLDIPSRIDATTWGGLCLEYSSTKEFAISTFGTDESKDAQPYFMVPAQTTKDVIDIPWTKFNKGSWGSNPPDITTAVTSLKAIVIEFNHFGENTETTFNIYKLGKYGTCN